MHWWIQYKERKTINWGVNCLFFLKIKLMMMVIMICFSLQQVDDRLCVFVSTIIIRGNLRERERERIFFFSLFFLFSSNRKMKFLFAKRMIFHWLDCWIRPKIIRNMSAIFHMIFISDIPFWISGKHKNIFHISLP
jgi:hypothetical protein